MTITVSSKYPDRLQAFVDLCKTIDTLCKVGSSRTIHVHVDGDGRGGHFRVDTLPSSAQSIKPFKGEYHIGIS